MPIVALVAAAAAFAAALAALGTYHLAWVRPELGRMRRLLAAHDALIGGGASGAAGRLAQIEAAQADAHAAVQSLSDRFTKLEGLAGTDLSHIGFVRYNALDDTGSDLSYALALLNRAGDGVVLSSIYSRTDTRTYGKVVNRFVPVAAASEEELQAIERARTAPAAIV